ncbi:MAG: hypothetical protein JEY94_02875 [Melioribacteraceae bacterium]|nr:hypothetical protein [Melioribacteraceae bacterium]
MKRFLLIILIFLSITLSAQREKPKNPGSRIITSEMLHKSGILNIGDIFLLAKNTYTSTIEGNNLYINQNGLSPFQEQESIILIDGIRCDINIFRNQNTHVLPITIEQVDFIEFINTPTIVEGEFNSNGIIHIHTKKPPDDLTIRLGYNIGNEIGDPGPYTYINENAKNVDKLPMNFNLNLNYKGSKGYFIGTIKSMEGFATDESIQKRIDNITIDRKKFSLLSASFKLRYTDIGEYQDFFFGYSENQNYFFFTPYGNELPLKHSYRQYGLNGLFKLDKNISLKYLLIRNENTTSDWNNSYPQNFNWEFKKTTVRISSSYNGVFFNLTSGLEYSELEGITNQQLDKSLFSYKKLFGDFCFQTSTSLNQSIGIELKDVGENNSINIYNKNVWKLSKTRTVSSNFSFSEQLLENSNSFWKWNKYGYEFFNDNVKEYGDIPESFGKKFTSNLTFNNRLTERLAFEIAGYYRHFFDYAILQQQYYFNEQTNLFSSPTTFYKEEYLKNLNVTFEIDYNTSEYVNQTLFFSYQNILSASDNFKSQWNVFPKLNAVYEIDYHPHPTFSVWCQINFQSESLWNNYHYLPEQSENFYKNRIDEKILINLSFQKWFWQKKVWFNISFRNLLNETERYYPIGSEFNLRFYAQFKVYLNSVLD